LKAFVKKPGAARQVRRPRAKLFHGERGKAKRPADGSGGAFFLTRLR
jgi:hypothetical protein